MSNTIYSLKIFIEHPLTVRHWCRQCVFFVGHNRDKTCSIIFKDIYLTLGGIIEDSFSTQYLKTCLISIFAIERRRGLRSEWAIVKVEIKI